MTQMPPQPPMPGSHLQPHRGVMILVFGILGFAVCMIFGIVAWVMGNNDLRAMDAGQMDPTGRSLTQAGKICGMIATILFAVIIGLYLVFFIIAMILAAVS